MKNMRKVLAMLISLMLVVSLAACSKEASESAPPTIEESVPPTTEPSEEPVAAPVSAEELIGQWEILGWTVDADGSWAPLDAPQYYTFDGAAMEYDTGAGVMSTGYTVEGSDLKLTDWELTWPMSLNDEGQLLLGDDRYAITYVCERAERPENVTPAPEPSKEPVAAPVSAEELIGQWEILGWTVDADGSWAPLDAPQYYTFDGTTMEYDTGADVMSTGYTVDGSDLNLTDWGLTWPMSLNDKGQLLLGDSRYGITYVCELVEG